MKLDRDPIVAACRVRPGRKVRIANFDPADECSPELATLGNGPVKERAQRFLETNRAELSAAQELLWASNTHSVLVILQAMDAAGKDGTIKHVMSGVNPQGCNVYGFKRPSELELDHNFLWRYWDKVPERGLIGIFNRSYYEEVLVVKVHPEVLARERLPPGKHGTAFWAARYADINHFERHLARNGTRVVKFFLNISKAEQKRRLLARLDAAGKQWKFSVADLAERDCWDEYMVAYQDMLRATSTKWAPWYVIPADHKYVARALVASILTRTIRSLGLEYPKVTPLGQRALAAARRQLRGE